MATKASKNSARKTTKYHSWPKFLHRFSKNQLVASIVILAVAFLGVLSILFSAAETPTGVNFVLFCPPAGYTCSGSTATLTSYAKNIQSWYGGQIGGGRRFKMGTVTVRYARYAPSYYSDTSTTTTGHLAALSKISSELGISDTGSNPTKTAVLLGFQMFHQYCGYSRIPGAMSVSDPVLCPYSTLMPSLMAHELGHSFGLAYNAGGTDPIHRTDGSLMTANACGNKVLSQCVLNASDRNYLSVNQSAWFPGPTGTLSCATNSTNVTLTYSYFNAVNGGVIHKYSAAGTFIGDIGPFPAPAASGRVDGGAVRSATTYIYRLQGGGLILASATCRTL